MNVGKVTNGFSGSHDKPMQTDCKVKFHQRVCVGVTKLKLNKPNNLSKSIRRAKC